MKIPMQMEEMEEVQNVAFSLATNISQSYTRIVRTGNIIMVSLRVKSSGTLSSETNLLKITDTSVIPSSNVYSMATNSGAVYQLTFVPGSGELHATVQTGTHNANSWISGQISWVVGN